MSLEKIVEKLETEKRIRLEEFKDCLLYTSDAADE